MKKIKFARAGNIAVAHYKGKEIVALIGRGDFCECGDCPVLYGGECPFDDPAFREKWSRKKKSKRSGLK